MSAGLQSGHRLDQLQPRPYSPLGIVLMGLRIAKVDQNAVAHVLRHEAAEAPHSLGDAFLIRRNDLAQVLRVHARRECCRTDEVREHHGDLAALSGVPWGGRRSRRNGVFRSLFHAADEFGYRSQQLQSMT